MPRKHRRNPEYFTPPPAAPPGSRRSDPPPWAVVPGYEIRQVAGLKEYRCPGCDHLIRAGSPHLVVVPEGDAESRRHWHTECWRRELRRLGLLRPTPTDD